MTVFTNRWDVSETIDKGMKENRNILTGIPDLMIFQLLVQIKQKNTKINPEKSLKFNFDHICMIFGRKFQLVN